MTDDDPYLSLSAASRQLGVHSTTLRRWADAGAIPVYITPGGHRRFARHDIEALVERRPLGAEPLTAAWAQRALAQTRSELARPHGAPAWLGHLPPSERESWRLIGQQLMGLVLRYVNAPGEDDEAALQEARALGQRYAIGALRIGMPLTNALEAALFFRDSLVEAAMTMPEEAHVRAEVHARLLRRISQVANVVQLAVAEGYEVRG
jgi:excisionase family DNA binding protein